MKKAAEIKYPNSANLFQFCRKVLDHKFGGIRVIDQDVGQILGFDPADCSHWKKGKKNIRSIQAMKSIASHLGVDEKLVVDIASGDLDDSEALYEFHGYGSFAIDDKLFDTAKKDFYRKNASTWTREKEQHFRDQFDIQKDQLKRIVEEVHTKINFEESPLYLPEVVAAYPQLSLVPVESEEIGDKVESIVADSGDTKISYAAGREVKPYMRFRIAKEMAKFFLREYDLNPPQELDEHGDHIIDVQSNIIAAMLLTPSKLIRNEMKKLNVAKDIVSQLAEVFWVSKTFMNMRLKEILQES